MMQDALVKDDQTIIAHCIFTSEWQQINNLKQQQKFEIIQENVTSRDPWFVFQRYFQ